MVLTLYWLLRKQCDASRSRLPGGTWHTGGPARQAGPTGVALLAQQSIVGAGVCLVYLCAAVYFTRATARRVLGALVGGVAVAAVGYGVELACQALGLWYYPSDDTGRGPLLMYPSLAFLWATL